MALRPVHRHRLLRRDRLFRDRSNPFDVYDDIEIYERFRFRRHQIFEIIDEVREDLEHHFRQRGSLPAEVQVLIALRFFASGSFQNIVGDTVGVHKSTVSRTIVRVSRVLRNLINRWVRLPDQRESNQQKQAFFALAGFPGVIGCVDCTHIKILAPSEDENEFVNRHGQHSINVQLVCDSDCKIINCVVRYPGSAHDARILSESQLYRDMDSVNPPLNGYLLGDSAYPLKNWLMPPYLNTNNEMPKERYNMAHSSTRQTIERCNGILKRRFYCLQETLRYAPKRAVNIIMACIVLHNIAIFYKLPEPLLDDHDDRHAAANHVPRHLEGNPGRRARAIRDSIVENFFQE